ncbi:hypothetical protein A3A93_02515 [Candidatus Roizmanbacteria bacterium RIFCSPLOWO2_01_FULL_38_12]|uniref:Pyrimidine nucleoside phosphorylase C-terminal domain-containing protein n=1 Tax=Candidatus Roizmanbacteria bacterium RIFCSPLOWO2_01_FULL_38_12 TaxID=1802061 RepID=A0A1F7J0B4_9BACT|nr:MAG: hypothetical protein A2861_00470 [Candidatus Roizmanbacteria bacterium RIFCSPHIGHO2_01_FULL_38_15]OGK49045.1 MAG: hypothetical protein A3A93_02515 [Candidatus Roizmanbacteria bacterium RIFCSPLOWO2_01_FULL_38_12]
MNDKTNLLHAIDVIKKKLRGRQLNYKEIYTLMDEIAGERLGDVLTAYFVAAGFKDGFTPEELYFLTKAMVETGTVIDFKGIVADKHSMGGVAGTRSTMIVVPIVTAAGFIMPKTSSRAITSPAGTADVMEVLAKVNFTPEQIKKIVTDVGGCIVWGGHLGIAPADDVIIRVEEPLSFESFDKIIMSIMAKKIAVSANHLVIDMPVGKTMKVKYEKDAEKIRKKFEDIAKRFDITVDVDINNTHEPAGDGIGPVLEAIDVLKVLEQTDDRPKELEKRSLRLATKLLKMCYKTKGEKIDAEIEAKKILESGRALEQFRKIIKAQYGDPDISYKKIKIKAIKKLIKASESGTIRSVNNFNLNSIAKILGAPSEKSAGLKLLKRRSDSISINEPLIELYATNSYQLTEAEDTLNNFPIFDIQ